MEFTKLKNSFSKESQLSFKKISKNNNAKGTYALLYQLMVLLYPNKREKLREKIENIISQNIKDNNLYALRYMILASLYPNKRKKIMTKIENEIGHPLDTSQNIINRTYIVIINQQNFLQIKIKDMRGQKVIYGVLNALARPKENYKGTQKLARENDKRLEELVESLVHVVNSTEHNSSDKNKNEQKRRTFRAKKRKLVERRDKMREHQDQQSIYGQRNSYSKTDQDATFMRVKEDPMQNGQLKPAYNLQIATSGQFITGYQLFQNPTDTRTLQPFIKHLQQHRTLGTTIVADAGYGSESNYRFLEDSLPEHTALIPYGTMIKENSRKWKSDDRKVMNWDYYEADDYYVDSKGVRFNFKAYRKRTDKYGFIRDFKEYVAEKLDENQNVISEALTPKGNLRRIQVNSAWEYFKAQQRDLLSTSQAAAIYAQRKIDVEPIFGKMKASLRFHRFSQFVA